MMEEMMFNLCENAVKYNREGGEVNIRVYVYGEGDSTVVLEVADTGVGIPADLRERCF